MQATLRRAVLFATVVAVAMAQPMVEADDAGNLKLSSGEGGSILADGLDLMADLVTKADFEEFKAMVLARLEVLERTGAPTQYPTPIPTEQPTAKPTTAPTVAPSPKPTAAPSPRPSTAPTAPPTAVPTTPTVQHECFVVQHRSGKCWNVAAIKHPMPYQHCSYAGGACCVGRQGVVLGPCDSAQKWHLIEGKLHNRDDMDQCLVRVPDCRYGGGPDGAVSMGSCDDQYVLTDVRFGGSTDNNKEHGMMEYSDGVVLNAGGDAAGRGFVITTYGSHSDARRVYQKELEVDC